MKNILIAIIYCLICVSCESSNEKKYEQTKQNESTESYATQTDSVDSSKTKVELPQDKSISSEGDVEKHTEKVSGDSDLKKYLCYMVVAMSIIAIIALRALFRKDHWDKIDDMNEQIRKIKEEFKKSSPRQKDSERIGSLSNTSIQEKIQELEKKISIINSRLSVMESKLNSLSLLPSPRVTHNESNKEMYFGNVKGTFFNDVFNSCKDEAKFKVKITGNEGTFEPIDLKRISSLDNISKAVKYEGNIQLNSATGFVVQTVGKVHKDDNVWIIDNPVIIKLTK